MYKKQAGKMIEKIVSETKSTLCSECKDDNRDTRTIALETEALIKQVVERTEEILKGSNFTIKILFIILLTIVLLIVCIG